MVYFNEFFDIPASVVEDYGAFNISLINDLPLFIDPFLLFGSEKDEYQKLHNEILEYLLFLKTKAESQNLTEGQISAWYYFPEEKQNWLGYSKVGNNGSGLGRTFGEALSTNISKVFSDLGNEKVTATSHLEKAALFQIGVGKDNVSDFTCNLIKSYLLKYTEDFALANLNTKQVKVQKVKKAFFDYNLQRWMPKEFSLPFIFGDYVILTPRDILTKDDNWINNHDLIGNFDRICGSIPNAMHRAEINNYFKQQLPIKAKNKKITEKEKNIARYKTLYHFPEILDYYIKYKENDKDGAKSLSDKNVSDIEAIFIDNVLSLVDILKNESDFYKIKPLSSYEEAHKRVGYLKHVIENNDGYKLFYYKKLPIKRESDLQVIYRLTWFATEYDVNSEVNNGRGPVDYKISRGAKDQTLIEFKLASNSQLKKNLEKQVEVYEKANSTNNSIKVILYFTASEYASVNAILKELKLLDNDNIILIDARNDNKPSGSKA